MSFRHFRLLIWKNFHLKLYHWIVTILELLLPIGITWLVLYVASKFFSGPQNKIEMIPTYSRSIKDVLYQLREFCYSPATPITNSFMEKLSEIQSHFIITPSPNETEMEKYFWNSGERNIIGVHFRNLKSNTSTPYKFSYILMDFIDYSSIKDLSTRSAAQLILNLNFIRYTNPTIPLTTEQIEETLNLTEVQAFPSVSVNDNVAIIVPFYVFCLVIFIFSISFMGDILEEKNSGIKEQLMMTIAICIPWWRGRMFLEFIIMHGVNEVTIWLAWFIYALCGILISITVCTVMLKMYSLNTLGGTMFNYVPFFILWLFLMLYCVANISFCFALTSIFHTNAVVTIVFSLYYVLMIIITLTSIGMLEQYLPLYAMCLSPVIAYHVGFSELLFIEKNGIEFTWSIFTNSQKKAYPLPFGTLYIFCVLMFDAILYLFLAHIITNVNPGKFGTPKSPFFLFKRLFRKNADTEDELLSSAKIKMDPKYFESPPSNLKASIRIINLHKRFKSHHAVRGVNLVTYKDEITVLLGHNGAGKTTTMSMLTGLISPSSGNVFYNGMNVFENMGKFRSHLGLCPQENRTIHYLSVMDHLLFFGQLKGASKKQAAIEAEEYLKKINLASKRNSEVRQLSGGMIRKLCLCIAMMGKAKVLILDEPSSGMDTEARRSLWDLLLNMRAGRSMILTTHYMEEADALGDRIAIMNHGIIVCHGTSMFLKKAYDTGYELTITKSSDNSAAITQLVQSSLPTASVVLDTRREIVYKLPLTDTPKFPALFRQLESSMMQLGVESVGVSATTMEQVFLIAGEVSTAKVPKSPKIMQHLADDSQIFGISLVIQQLWAVFKKKFLFTTRDLTNLFVRVILPTIFLCLVLRLSSSSVPSIGEPFDVTLSDVPNGVVIYEEVEPAVTFGEQVAKYVAENGGVYVKGNGSGIKTILHSMILENIDSYQTNLVSAIDINQTNTRLMYNFHIKQSLPITIDVYSNALLRKIANSKEYSIETTSHPIISKYSISTNASDGCVQPPKTSIDMFVWLLVLGVFTSDILVYFWNFVSVERMDGFYHIQMMSRLSPVVYWSGTLLFDFTLFAIAMIIRMALFKIFGSMAIIGFHEGFYSLLLMLTLYGISTLLWIYVLTFLINLRQISTFFFLIINVTCLVFAASHQTFLPYVTSNHDFAWYFVNVGWWFIYTIPILTFYKMILNVIEIFSKNSLCMYCPEFHKPVCEAQLKKVSYMEFPSKENPLGILTMIQASCGQIVAYFLILRLLDSGLLGRIFNIIKNIIFGTKSTQTDSIDDDVRQERDYVQQFRNLVSTGGDFNIHEDEEFQDTEEEEEELEFGYISVANKFPKSRLRRRKKMNFYEFDDIYEESSKISLLVDGLRKNYISWFRKFTAVSNVSFVVEPGTCFGLLGVNGAGKSTTFKMLTAEIIPTSGDARIDDFKLSEKKSEYLAVAGYCPQTNCFIEQLTGLEMLTIIASMRGVQARNRRKLVDKWISIIGLEEYKNRRCGSYSGGNKRKLCSAMSLIGDPHVVFLDEPTSGVDPVSRRNLYDVMAQSRASGQTVVLTSHSMEECETLCDRLTIMVSGVMKCIGSAQHLKKVYAQGFSALFKVFDSIDARDRIYELKQTIEQVFNPSRIILKDEHTGLLYYQITDTTLPWSVLFELMENIKTHHQDIVQDYVITDTTLEEVFISFAKNR